MINADDLSNIKNRVRNENKPLFLQSTSKKGEEEETLKAFREHYTTAVGTKEDKKNTFWVSRMTLSF